MGQPSPIVEPIRKRATFAEFMIIPCLWKKNGWCGGENSLSHFSKHLKHIANIFGPHAHTKTKQNTMGWRKRSTFAAGLAHVFSYGATFSQRRAYQKESNICWVHDHSLFMEKKWLMGWRKQSVSLFKAFKTYCKYFWPSRTHKNKTKHDGVEKRSTFAAGLSHVFSYGATFSQRRAYQKESNICWVHDHSLFMEKMADGVEKTVCPRFQQQKAFKINFKVLGVPALQVLNNVGCHIK